MNPYRESTSNCGSRPRRSRVNPIMRVLVQDLEASGAIVACRSPNTKSWTHGLCSTPARRISFF